MNYKLNRANPEAESLAARLDEIRMPAYERLTAQAHLARAELISDWIVAAVRAFQSLFAKRASTCSRLARTGQGS